GTRPRRLRGCICRCPPFLEERVEDRKVVSPLDEDRSKREIDIALVRRVYRAERADRIDTRISRRGDTVVPQTAAELGNEERRIRECGHSVLSPAATTAGAPRLAAPRGGG